MLRICTICVRGGSKGVKGKNIRLLAGKPLLAHTLAQARASGLFTTIAVSSDSQEILGIARQWGADAVVERPESLASDVAPKVPAILHCVETVEAQQSIAFEQVVDLDATAPLRTVGDIQGAVGLLESSGAGNVVSGCASHHSPYFNMVELQGGVTPRLIKALGNDVLRRQDAPRCYDLNGSVYVWRRSTMNPVGHVLQDDTRLFEMPRERSLDIDTELDFELVSYLFERTHGSQEPVSRLN